MAQQGGVISYPIPAYANVPIHAEFYSPSRLVISAITLGKTTLVTTSTVQDYFIGQLVRLIIPPGYGARQLNETESYVISILSTTQVELDLDSTQSDAFTNPGTGTVAQILAIGDINQGAINSSGRSPTGTYIPGSFIDIS